MPEPTELVALAPGEKASARRPTDAERRTYRLGEGVPVFVITAPDGSVTVHPADRVQLTRP
ncbi:hypothetical protein [Actinoplanes sp. NPDC051859]|uniref:hypothetical protein n=1 Tax=Actinoplanes sp. NPDC051859 TaxID=3363909 RepID=UPI0037ABA524